MTRYPNTTLQQQAQVITVCCCLLGEDRKQQLTHSSATYHGVHVAEKLSSRDCLPIYCITTSARVNDSKHLPCLGVTLPQHYGQAALPRRLQLVSRLMSRGWHSCQIAAHLPSGHTLILFTLPSCNGIHRRALTTQSPPRGMRDKIVVLSLHIKKKKKVTPMWKSALTGLWSLVFRSMWLR